jgi:uncharacterized protein YdaU (DUF1376 family)
MKTDIWMPLYIGDYLGDTMHLSTEQHGAYLLLIMAYWKNHGPIPDTDAWLSQATGMHDAWSKHKEEIAKFFTIQAGLWHHKRIDAELAKAEKNSSSRSNAARTAANARHSKRASRIPDAPLTHNQRKTEAVPSPSPSQSEALNIESFKGLQCSKHFYPNGMTDEKSLIEDCVGILGHDNMKVYGGNWRLRARSQPKALRGILDDTWSAMKEKRIGTTPGQYANDLWERNVGL